MATRQQIERTYNYMDDLFRLAYGENGDISCALYNGDFSQSLDEAQKAKHSYILDSLRFTQDDSILDIGCGWGPMLKAVAERGGHATGLTLSTRQAMACRRNGHTVHLQDWKSARSQSLGIFDGIACVEAFEHFCSVEEYRAGRQDEIYDSFFRFCRDHLRPGGRLYVQTMVWGRNAPKFEDVSLKAKRGSNEYIVAVLGKFYPGSWAAFGDEHIVRVAEPYFATVARGSGREDYCETMRQFGKRNNRRSAAGLVAKVTLLRHFVTDRDFRYKLESLLGGYNRLCFEREILDLSRLVFERR